ncbi:hypothetical protein BDN67DRAFT_985252 [Paxillus ammoniavirescens]|nr:hypothetical protein BDN67DRAFT_985252 [Paxillus ammoniavirescens]
MTAQLDQDVTSTQQQVEACYWCMVAAISKLILIKDHTKFKMEKELTSAWKIIFTPSIMYYLRETYNNSDATLNAHTIPKIFEKGYLINNKDVTSDIPLVVKRAAEKAHTADKEVVAEKKTKAKAEMGKAQAQEQSNALVQGGPSGLKIRVK